MIYQRLPNRELPPERFFQRNRNQNWFYDEYHTRSMIFEIFKV